MQCPNACPTPLVMSERQGVEIDYCPTCRGVWLDRGELDKIIDRVAVAPAAPPLADTGVQRGSGSSDGRDVRMVRNDDRSTPGKPKKKRGSFLEDLFDFGG
jgi:Zn-finger nucleic acid-binding protein